MWVKKLVQEKKEKDKKDKEKEKRNVGTLRGN